MQPISWESRVAHLELGGLAKVPAKPPEYAETEPMGGSTLEEEVMTEQPLTQTKDKTLSMADATPEENS